MPPSHKSPLGVLLAGGLARRMGGGKPLRSIGGRTILERAIARLIPQCDGLILNANDDADSFAAFGLPLVPDNVDGFRGPLAGLLAAFDWAVTHRPDVEWVMSAPADAPFLPRDLAARLQQAQAVADAPVVVAASGGRMHSVVGLWNVALRDDLRHALVTEDIRRVSLWIARHKTATAEWPVEPVDSFFNVNTTEDLTAAERLAAIEDRRDDGA